MLLKYSENLYQGRGEGFLHTDDSCAVSFFRFPNSNNLKGIGLHKHLDCDDIDILVKGEIRFFKSKTQSFLIRAPSIVPNFAGMSHAIIANKKSLLFGVRSPFKGGSISQEKISHKQTQIIESEKLSQGSHQIFDSPFTLGIVHKNINHIKIKLSQGIHYFFNLSGEAVTLGDFKMNIESVLRIKGHQKLEIENKEATILQIIPKVIK